MLTRFFLAAAACAAAAPVIAQSPPPGADVVPTNAFAFVSVKVADLWDAAALKPARDVLTQGGKPPAAQFEALIGIKPEEIERVTLFWSRAPLGPGGEAPFVVLTTREPYNEARLLKALRASARPGQSGARDVEPELKSGAAHKDPPPVKKCGEEAAGDQPADAVSGELFFLARPDFVSVYLLDDRSVLFFPRSHDAIDGANLSALVGQLLKRKADGPLAEALKLAGKHTVVAAARFDQVAPAVAVGFPRVAVVFRSLLKAKTVLVTADVAAKAEVAVRLTFPDAADARRADPVLRTLIQTGSEELAALRKDAEKDETTAGVTVPLLELAVKSLEAADVKTEGTVVAARADVEIGPAVTKAMAAAPAVIGDSSDRVKTQNNLKQIGLAIHNYHDVNGFFPADVTDANGKPILSWRAQLLPYLEQDQLFRRLDLKKPWDDPANKEVLDRMPDVFRVYGRETKDKRTTYFQMFWANMGQGGSPFLVPGRRTTFANVTDGLSNTLMVVEAADPVIWLQPDDIQFDPKNLPKLGSPTRGRFQALFGDGSVREFRRAKLSDDALRALITINGGEVITFPD